MYVSISVHLSPVMLEQTHRQRREGPVCPLQAEEMVSQVEGAGASPESSKLDMPLRWEQWYATMYMYLQSFMVYEM